MATAHPAFHLARGLPTPDWKHYYTARTELDETIVEAHALSSGKLEKSFALNGAWNLESVSASGRSLALGRLLSDGEMVDLRKGKSWKTDLEIVEASAGAVVHTLSLEGNFEVVAVSDDSLFLVENLPATDPDHFVIRLYDLTTEKLSPDPLRETRSEEVLAGDAIQQLATPDGNLLLTLYLDAGRHSAYINALDLVRKSASSVYLPSGDGDLARLKAYTLALSPATGKAFAVNGVLGVLAVIGLDPVNVRRTVQFAQNVDFKSDSSDTLQPTSVVSNDGRRLFYADRNEIWAFDTSSGRMTDNYLLGNEVNGLGVNSGATRLYAATPSGLVRAFIVPINGTLVPLASAVKP